MDGIEGYDDFCFSLGKCLYLGNRWSNLGFFRGWSFLWFLGDFMGKRLKVYL